MLEFGKGLLAKVACRLRLWKIVYFCHRLCMRRPRLAVFTYHRVTDQSRGLKGYLEYDHGLDKRVFELQIQTISRYFRFIDLNEFEEIIAGRRRPSRPAALVTFDDADSELVEHAFPLLVRKGIPAVVFAATGYVDGGYRMWHLRLSNLIHNAAESGWRRVQVETEGLPDSIRSRISEHDLSTPNDRRLAARRIAIALDRLSIQDAESVVSTLERLLPGEYSLGIRSLSWSEIRGLSSDKVSFQSHTVNHPKLAHLDSEQIRAELIESRRALEAELGRTVTAVCFPAGVYNEQVLELVREAGYTIGFTGDEGFCRYPLSETERLAVKRLGMRGATESEADLFLGTLPLRRFRRRRRG
jgi:peptidoglycan/xylan/chitin deacetylase (PgdA/CDA1 family)